jgi:hypothetical protein
MVKKTKRVSIDKAQSGNHLIIAQDFYKGAKAATEQQSWNAAGVLIVHSAIAFADTITIKYGGVKSRGDNHLEVITILEEIVPSSEKNKKALHQLYRLIDHKNAVSYGGNIYNEKDIEQLWKYLHRFKDWVNTIIEK